MYHCEGKNQAQKNSIRISQMLLLKWHVLFFYKNGSRMETITKLHMVIWHLPFIMAPKIFTF
jgi:hypothetical protein